MVKASLTLGENGTANQKLIVELWELGCKVLKNKREVLHYSFVLLHLKDKTIPRLFPRGEQNCTSVVCKRLGRSSKGLRA